MGIGTSKICVTARPMRSLGWLSGIYRIRSWCIAWWHSGREESDTKKRAQVNKGKVVQHLDPYNSLSSTHQRDMALVSSGGAATQVNATPTRLVARDCRSLPPANRLVASSHSTSTDTVYTFLIKLPPTDRTEGETDGPSIKIIPEDRPTIGSRHDGYSLNAAHSNHVTRRTSAMPDIRIPLNAKIIPKRWLAVKTSCATLLKHRRRRRRRKLKRRRQIKRQRRRCRPYCFRL
ncbi:hypothetical protein WA026_012660 [Henosepilachna vigintioctopunctata]|uniref:Uncharacterized protein n=1 Tax=Henosepilachna vigintioctopunctata TaxID=420089 RepID=A0AAW1U6V2_9CUCU